jgi:hypothetical protein
MLGYAAAASRCNWYGRRQERSDVLEALGFIWDPFEEDFQIGLGYLKVYKAERGDCRVLQRFKAEDGFALGNWCTNRRKDYTVGGKTKARNSVNGSRV